MKLDPYKEAILQKYLKSNSHIAINATAGSGKTTMLVDLCKNTPTYKRVLFLAYNKSIVEELKSKLPESIDVATLHSQAYRSVLKKYKTNFNLKNNAHYPLAKAVVSIPKTEKETYYILRMLEFYNLLRINCITNKTELHALLEGLEYTFTDKDLDNVFLIKEACDNNFSKISRFRPTYIDFTDMLYLCNEKCPKSYLSEYDVVMIDEAQDINRIQFELIKKLIKPSGRIISVGDQYQAIYGFQGASVENFNRLKSVPNTISMPLSTTYRCAERIVKEAKKVFKYGNIECLDKANKGQVINNGSYLDAVSGDFILCRNNKPLFDAYINLLLNNKKAYILGKDFQIKIESITKELNARTSIDCLIDKIQDKYLSRGIKKLTYCKEYCVEVEPYEVVKKLLSYYKTPERLLKNIDKIFESDKNAIVLVTIHKSKGLESENVYFLDPDLLPSKYAKTTESLYGEDCLKFVAITRAKNKLIYCKSII